MGGQGQATDWSDLTHATAAVGKIQGLTDAQRDMIAAGAQSVIAAKAGTAQAQSTIDKVESFIAAAATEGLPALLKLAIAGL